MTNPTQVSGPGRPMNERREAAKEQEGLDEVLNGDDELQTPADAEVDRQSDSATGGSAG